MLNIEHRTSNIERDLRRAAANSTPAARAPRILKFASFALFADRDWQLGSRRDLHAGSARSMIPGFAPFA